MRARSDAKDGRDGEPIDEVFRFVAGVFLDPLERHGAPLVDRVDLVASKWVGQSESNLRELPDPEDLIITVAGS